jgi:Tfp pilus assembly protein PilF
MINKNHPQSYGNLGLCYMQIGKKEEAVKALDKALEIDPNYGPALANKAIIESLADGEKLPNKFKSIEYYKDFKFQNGSYLNSILDDDK